MNGKQKILTSVAIGLIIAIGIAAATTLVPLPATTSPKSELGATTTTQTSQPISTETVTTTTTTQAKTGTTQTTATQPETTPQQPSIGMGTLILSVKDVPAPKRVLQTLEIRIDNIVLHRAPGGNESVSVSRVNFTVTDPVQFYNITALTGGLSAIVGNTTVPTGKYTMIVFEITGAKAKFMNPDTGVVDADYTNLRVVANGKLMAPVQFDIQTGMTTEVTLDFQLDQMQVNPNDILRPVITPIVKGPSSSSQGSGVGATDAPRNRPESPTE